jgi:hypothetical protein
MTRTRSPWTDEATAPDYERRVAECRRATQETRQEAVAMFVCIAFLVVATVGMSLLVHGWKAVFQ